MPPRLAPHTARSLVYRPRPRMSPVSWAQRFASDGARLPGGEDASTPSTQPKGPNTDQLPHVTEEQAAIDKSMGETPPDISQGTPVQEILKRDPEAKEKAPEVIKRQIEKGNTNQAQNRSYSTSARRPAELEVQSTSDIVNFDQTMAQGLSYPDAGLGHKFPLPDVSTIPRTDHLKRRYDPVVEQVTKALMQHGKLSIAQKNMSLILDALRTSPAPQPNALFPSRTLLTATPRAALPLEPIAYLTTIIDSVAPLIKIRQQRGLAGGGASLPIPVPLGMKQRRRQAITWILDSASKRRETALADRVSRELISVAEGKSSAWERRTLVHKLAVSARSNVRAMLGGGKTRMRR